MCLYPSTNTPNSPLCAVSLCCACHPCRSCLFSGKGHPTLPGGGPWAWGGGKKALLAAGANVHASTDVSGEEGRLDYRDGVPHMRGGVRIKGAGPHVPPQKNTHTTLACSRAEWLLLLPGLCCNICFYPSTNTRSPSPFRFSLIHVLLFAPVSSQDKSPHFTRRRSVGMGRW